VVQIALAVTLVASAALLAKSYRHATDRGHLGFHPENLLVLRVNLDGPKYTRDEDIIAVARQYLARLPKVPGVKDLALSGPTIPTDEWVGNYITIEDHDSDTPLGTYTIMMHSISPGYFKAMGVPILQGRAFTMEDASPVGAPFNAIVSKEMAELHWPGQSPIGKRVKFGVRNGKHPWLPVVGVVGDVQHEGLMKEKRPAPDIYLPILAFPIRLPTTLNVLATPREGVSTASLVSALQREIQAITPDTPAYDAATLEERLAKQTQKGRFLVELAAYFALLALLLATVSVYCAVASAARGIRGGMSLAGIGVALGLLGVWVLNDRLVGLLHGASVNDPLILGGISALVLLLALLASALGTRRLSGEGEVSRPDRPVLGGRAAL
jgi:hypothetical protein